MIKACSRGFTLIEVLVAFAVLTLMVVGVVFFFSSETQKQEISEKHYETVRRITTLLSEEAAPPQSTEELYQKNPGLEAGFGIYQEVENKNHVYLTHDIFDGLNINRLPYPTVIVDGVYRMYIGLGCIPMTSAPTIWPKVVSRAGIQSQDTFALEAHYLSTIKVVRFGGVEVTNFQKQGHNKLIIDGFPQLSAPAGSMVSIEIENFCGETYTVPNALLIVDPLSINLLTPTTGDYGYNGIVTANGTGFLSEGWNGVRVRRAFRKEYLINPAVDGSTTYLAAEELPLLDQSLLGQNSLVFKVPGLPIPIDWFQRSVVPATASGTVFIEQDFPTFGRAFVAEATFLYTKGNGPNIIVPPSPPPPPTDASAQPPRFLKPTVLVEFVGLKNGNPIYRITAKNAVGIFAWREDAHLGINYNTFFFSTEGENPWIREVQGEPFSYNVNGSVVTPRVDNVYAAIAWHSSGGYSPISMAYAKGRMMHVHPYVVCYINNYYPPATAPPGTSKLWKGNCGGGTWNLSKIGSDTDLSKEGLGVEDIKTSWYLSDKNFIGKTFPDATYLLWLSQNRVVPVSKFEKMWDYDYSEAQRLLGLPNSESRFFFFSKPTGN